MSQADLNRPLGLVLARLSLPLRTSLMQILPRGLRNDIAGILEEVEDLLPDEMSFVEQVLHNDLQTLLSEEDADAEERLLVEAWPLRVSDLLALILRHGSPQQAAAALVRLPSGLQGEVLHRLAVQDLGRLRGLLGRTEIAFLETLDGSWTEAARKADPAFAAELLGLVPSPRAVRRLLTEMHRMDPEPAVVVQGLLYNFDDLVALTDRELQLVLNGVDAWDLALAFRSASPALKRRVLANISERRAGHLAEDQAMVEDADEEDVAVVRHRLVARVRGLYEAGKVHTYFGSVGVGEQEDRTELDEAEEGTTGNGPDGPQTHRRTRWDLRGVLTALGAVALTGVLIGWLAEVRFTANRSGGQTSRARFSGSSDVQRRARGRSQGAGSEGAGGASGVGSDVALITGNVRVGPEEAGETVEGGALEPGDWVETSEDAQTVLRLWGEGGQVQVDGGSSVRVGEEGSDRQTPPRLDLRLGRIWVYVKHPSLVVASPVAEVTASEGALYCLRVVLDATTTVSVRDGTAWVRPLGSGDPSSLVLGPGDRLRIDPGGGREFEDGELEAEWLGLF